MLLNVVIGMIASAILQWVKVNPKISWLTPEMNKTLQALMVLVSIVAGTSFAAQEPGGLAKLDWQMTLKTIAENAMIIWAAGLATYQGFLKSHEKKDVPPAI